MFSLWFKMAMLAVESQGVIAQRMMVMAAGGPAAHREARLMVNEKVAALAEANASLVSGHSPASVVARYRQHVGANSRRLAERG